ncbi:11-beta-hydroxysteroid dehydrogenase 1b [Quercus suber]|uniref:11-beta-hydroxysteroid dehydrogenase 1b n=1 Tax=Quercus suber TaxID=58331 RepID=A0AAW0LXI8_QUESU
MLPVRETPKYGILSCYNMGLIYSNHNVVPPLRKRKGKIVVLASTVAWLAMPRMSFYNVRNLLDWNALQARQPRYPFLRHGGLNLVRILE